MADEEELSFEQIVLGLTPAIEKATKFHAGEISKSQECAQSLREQARLWRNRLRTADPAKTEQRDAEKLEDLAFIENLQKCPDPTKKKYEKQIAKEKLPLKNESIESFTKSFEDEAEILKAEAKKRQVFHDRVLKFFEVMKSENAFQKGWTASISASFDGDEAENRKSYNVKTSSNVSRGTFPRELRFRTTTKFELTETPESDTEDPEIQTSTKLNVTEALVNYDYHPGEHVQVSGFVERFSSDFLKIGTRYEAGISIKGEWEFGQVKNADGVSYTDAFDMVTEKVNSKGKGVETKFQREEAIRNKSCQRRDEFKTHRKWEDASRECVSVLFKCWLGIIKECKLNDIAISDLASEDQVDAFLSKRRTFRIALKKRKAKLAVGIAGSVFGEIEEPQALTSSIDDPTKEGDATLTFTPESEQTFRAVIRPSVEYRPIEEFRLRAVLFYKQGISPIRQNLADAEDPLDYRIDLVTTGELTLKKDKDNEDEVALVVGYTRRFDNVPPRVSALEVPRLGVDLIAPDTEKVYSLELKITWGSN